MKHNELSRFTESGKTFFFNQGRAGNGSPYLAINALYGKGQQQRLVLFPAQFFTFFRHYKDAVESITGFKAATEGTPYPPPSRLPESCPECDATQANFRVSQESTYWAIFCKACKTAIYVNGEVPE